MAARSNLLRVFLATIFSALSLHADPFNMADTYIRAAESYERDAQQTSDPAKRESDLRNAQEMRQQAREMGSDSRGVALPSGLSRQAQSELERRQLLEMQRKMELESQRQQIVNKAARNVQQLNASRDAVNTTIQGVGTLLLQQMQQNAARERIQREESRMQRAQDRLENEQRALEEESREVARKAQQADEFEKREPLVLARSQTDSQSKESLASQFVLPDPPANISAGVPAFDGGRPSDRFSSAVEPHGPNQEQILNALLADQTENALPITPVNDMPTSSVRFDAHAEAAAMWRDHLRQPVGRVMDQLVGQIEETGDVDLGDAVVGATKEGLLDQFRKRAAEWAKDTKIFNGKSWNELSEDDREWYGALGDVGNHAVGVFRKNPKQAIEGGDALIDRTSKAINKVANDNESDRQ